MSPFELLYEDEYLVAINKPPGILVHRTRLSEDTIFVLQLLRDQLGGAHLFPAHRLDRATSGVLVFAKNSDTASWLGEQLMDFKWEKKYLAVVRGYPKPEQGTIDYPLADPETGKKSAQEAITHYKTLDQVEQPWAIGLRYPTARFSLLEVTPQTGRRQQIRKHLSHLRHPIINDSRHGDVKFGRWFKEKGWPDRLMLHALELTLPHPEGNVPLRLHAPLDLAFKGILDKLGLSFGK